MDEKGLVKMLFGLVILSPHEEVQVLDHRGVTLLAHLAEDVGHGGFGVEEPGLGALEVPQGDVEGPAS